MSPLINYGGKLSPFSRDQLRSEGKTDDQIADEWASSNPRFGANLSRVRQKANNDPKATTSFMNYYLHGDPDYKSVVKEQEEPENTKLGLFGGNAIKRLVNHITDSQRAYEQKQRENIESVKTGGFEDVGFVAAKSLAETVSLGLSPITGLWDVGLTTDVPFTRTSATDVLGSILKPIGETDIVQDTVIPTLQRYMEASKDNPALEALNATGKAALDALIASQSGFLNKPAAQLGRAATHPLQTAKNIAEKAGGAIAHPVDTAAALRGKFPSKPAPNPFATSPVAVDVGASRAGAALDDIVGVGVGEIAAAEIPSAMTHARDILMRSGMDDRMSNLLLEASPSTRRSMLLSLQKNEAAAMRFQTGKSGVTNPRAVAGEVTLQRIRHIGPLQKEIGKRIGNVVEMAKTEPITLHQTYENFMKALSDNLVYLNEKGALVTDTGKLTKPDLAFLQKIFNRIQPDGSVRNFKDSHLTRQWLFVEQDLAKANLEGFSGELQKIANKAHSDMLADMSAVHSEYGVLAQPFAEMQSAVDGFARLMGRKSGKDLIDRPLKAGEVANRMKGNASAEVMEAIDKLDDVARRAGLTDAADIKSVVSFINAIDPFFPQFSPAGFQGGIEKGAARALGAVAKLKVGNVTGAAGDLIKTITGKSSEQQLKLIKNFLEQHTGDIAKAKTPEAVDAILERILGTEFVPKVKPSLTKPLSGARQKELIKNYKKNLDEIADKYPESMNRRTIAELEAADVIATSDGTVGVALIDDEIVGLFNNGGRKGAGKLAVVNAVEAGGKRLDALDTLREYYEQFGFKVIRQEKNFTKGKPDVIFMELDDSKYLKFKEQNPDLIRASKAEGLFDRSLGRKQGGGREIDPIIPGQAKFTTGENRLTGLKSLPDDVADSLRKAKGLSADDIMAKHPDLNLKREIVIKDIHGNKHVIDKGEALTPYELKGNKILLQDGETYIVSRSQYKAVQQNAVKGEAKAFAPELEGTTETIRGNTRQKAKRLKSLEDQQEAVLVKSRKFTDKGEDAPSSIRDEFTRLSEQIDREYGLRTESKYGRSDLVLPGGENYREILIQAPSETGRYNELLKIDRSKGLSVAEKAEFDSLGGYVGRATTDFKGSHFDESNIISTIRANERAFKKKGDTFFVEEIQSDWASAGRKQGFRSSKPKLKEDITMKFVEGSGEPNSMGFWESFDTEGNLIVRGSGSMNKKAALDDAYGFYKIQDNSLVPNNPLLKNWQKSNIKRGLQEAVESDAEYFAWITGEQTSARYNLSTKVDDVSWNPSEIGGKSITLSPKGGGAKIGATIDKKGKIIGSSEGAWKGKSLDEVLGKGLADKIMAKPKGKLSGKGLEFGGEWAKNLYDKQIPNIVKDVTGGRIIEMDLGLPVKHVKNDFSLGVPDGLATTRRPRLEPKHLKVGQEISSTNGINSFVIMEVKNKQKGIFTAINKDTLEILRKKPKGEQLHYNNALYPNPEVAIKDYTIKQTLNLPQSVTQQGIKLTEEIRDKIKGAAPRLKSPSHKSPF